MHHKRKGPKSTRAGCLLCKPHKHQGASGSESKTRGDLRTDADDREIPYDVAQALDDR